MSRKAGMWGMRYARQRFVVSVELPSRDPSYEWFLSWMARRVPWTQHMTIRTQFERTATSAQPKFSLLPSVGEHYFRYQGQWIKAERTRSDHLVLLLPLHLMYI